MARSPAKLAKPPPTHYQILQVHPAAPLELITSAYWRLVSQVHTAGRSDKASEIAVYHLTRSYQELATTQSRLAYDSSIGISAQHGAPHMPEHPRTSWVSSLLSGNPDSRERGKEVDYYELLRIDPLANAGIAAEAYLVMRNYYLRLIERAGVSRELIDLLAEGYDVVSDSRKRREYDRSLKARRRAAAAKARPGATGARRTRAQASAQPKSSEEAAGQAKRSKRTLSTKPVGANGRSPGAQEDPSTRPEGPPYAAEPASIKLVRSLASGIRLGGKRSITLAKKASETLRGVLVDDREAPFSIIDLTPAEEEALLERLSSFPDIAMPSETKPRASSSGALARLGIIEGPGLGRTFDVESVPFTLGEDDFCDMALPGLAPQQARLLHRDGHFVLFSLTDEPKTSIHGNTVAWAVLENGDSFKIGPYQLTFEAASPVPAPT